MSITIQSVPVPLRVNKDGVVRVGRSRVTLDTIVYAFRDGATAEEICQRYPAVTLPQVYSVIAFVLQNQTEVDKYMAEVEALEERTRAEVQAKFNPYGIRERLLARQKNAG
ncbi:MAG TPA: DUF433 domain-containing protein [Candidatus Xenobia bacterium]